MNEFKTKLIQIIKPIIETTDGSHDWFHLERVWKNCLLIAHEEKKFINDDILFASAFLHDLVNLPKNHPDRSNASYLSALKAEEILNILKCTQEFTSQVVHAVETHSYSAGKHPVTLEAQILQDADRLEALGAIGIARCFYVSGKMNRSLFHPTDPIGSIRLLNDQEYALDHFKLKLFDLPKSFQTATGKKVALERVELMKLFFDHIVSEVSLSSSI